MQQTLKKNNSAGLFSLISKPEPNQKDGDMIRKWSPYFSCGAKGDRRPASAKERLGISGELRALLRLAWAEVVHHVRQPWAWLNHCMDVWWHKASSLSSSLSLSLSLSLNTIWILPFSSDTPVIICEKSWCHTWLQLKHVSACIEHLQVSIH